jgi:hypothetical protein
MKPIGTPSLAVVALTFLGVRYSLAAAGDLIIDRGGVVI